MATGCGLSAAPPGATADPRTHDVIAGVLDPVEAALADALSRAAAAGAWATVEILVAELTARRRR
jgi:hypothetical protein